jgi:DNA-binding response OmpR family regulator
MDNKKEGNIKILIVDDEEEARVSLKLALEKRKFLVEEASNGREALENAAVSRPDVILLDGSMPIMDGFETCRCLRKNPETKNISIIFCTATYITEVKNDMAEVDDYIEKPFLLKELLSKIEKLLKKKYGG